MYALLDIPPLNAGERIDFEENHQLIFPDITFTCHGEVVRWIVVGRWEIDDDQFPELQVWRLLENKYRTVH